MSCKTNLFDLNKIELLPDYNCNLRCSFCYNSSITEKSRNFRTDIDYTKVYFDKSKELIDILSKKTDFIAISICGGEILADFWSDDYVKHLYEYLYKIHEYCLTKNLRLEVYLNSNLVHQKTERWVKFINDVTKFAKVIVNTSFDLYGRFNNLKTLNTFKTNIEIYAPYIEIINVLRTTEAVRILTSDNLTDLERNIKDTFNYLYKKFKSKLFIDEFVCNSDKTKNLQCSNEERYTSNIFLLEHYPDLQMYKFDKSSPKNHRCKYIPNITFDPNCEPKPECTYGGIGDEFIPELKNIKGDFNIKLPLIHNIAERKLHCLTCKYIKICPSACPMSIATLLKSDTDECYIKKTLDYIDVHGIYRK